jgi:prepilin-type N-terminal cleavage/methylation domain-containing protein/prepilin-type processing-associated H-X9-DG protein
MMLKVPLKLCRISVVRNRAANRGFTLIELLTVMAILILLLALLIPQLSKMQEESRRAGCRSNLRQLGAGMLLFAGDHNGWLPARYMQHVPSRGPGEGFDEYRGTRGTPSGFTFHILLLAGMDYGDPGRQAGSGEVNAQVYISDPKLWKCPSDRWNGEDDATLVKAAKAITDAPPLPFRSLNNASYMYVSGYHVTSYTGDHSLAPVLADESNEPENGSLRAGAMPQLGEKAAHGANFRNVLFLDGSVVAIKDADSANKIFDQVPPQMAVRLQSVD